MRFSLLFALLPLFTAVLASISPTTPDCPISPSSYDRACRCLRPTFGSCPSGNKCVDVGGARGWRCRRLSSGEQVMSSSNPSEDEKKQKRETRKKQKKVFTCEDEEEENKPDGIRKVACPIPGSLRGFDCIDIETDASQCGDCRVLGGIDCLSQPGVASAKCVKGKCHIDRCRTNEGFYWDFGKKSCVRTQLDQVYVHRLLTL